jgi:hypothetical protein
VARPRHRRKESEAVLVDAEAHGWRIDPGKRYWRAYCGCGLHLRSIHLTPSDPSYATNLAHWFRRTCGWPKEDG